MAFCGKCGKPVQDGAAFCASCGAPMNAAPQQPQYQQPQYQQPRQAGPAIGSDILKIPRSLGGWIGIAAVVVSFILLFLKWWGIKVGVGGFSYSMHFSIFSSVAFDASALIGIAKIFGIIAIVAFVCYVISYFININKLVPALKMDIEKIARLVYIVCYGLALVFCFIGNLTLSEDGAKGHFAAGFFIALVFYIVAILGTKRGFLEKYIPALK